MMFKVEKFLTIKRIFMVLVAFCALFASNSYTEAHYPEYLNNNPNLILTDGHMDSGTYYDKSSVVNMSYNPPYYKIAVNTVYVPNVARGNTAISNVTTQYFTYDYENRTLDVSTYNSKTNQWHTTYNIKPGDPMYKARGNLNTAELAFFQIYGLKFFNIKGLNYKAVL